MTTAKPLAGQATVVVKVPAVAGRQSVGVLAVSPDGMVVEKRSVADPSGALHQSSLRFQPTAKGAVRDLHTTAAEPQQAYVASANGRYVVWMETTSTEINVSPWVLYAADRKTHQVGSLAKSHLVHGHEPPPPPGDTGPVLIGDRVFWVEVSGRIGHERADVFGCKITRCEPRRYIRGAAFPATDGENMYAVRTARYTGSKAGDAMSVVEVDPATAAARTVQSAVLGHGRAPAGLAVNADQVVWVVSGGSRDTLTMWDRTTGSGGSVTSFRSEQEGAFGTPVATDSYVAWAETSGVAQADVGGYLFRLNDQRLFSIGNTAGLYNVVGSGDYVAWQDSKTPTARPQDIVTVVAKLK